MKRLVDSSSSDFSRSLLKAAIEHQPPAHGPAKLLIALGVGGGFTLATSKAFAWLATSAGKVTVVVGGIAVTSATVYLTNGAAPTDPVESSPRGGASVASIADELTVAPMPPLAASAKKSEPSGERVSLPSKAAEANFTPPKVLPRSSSVKRRARRRVDKASTTASSGPGDVPTEEPAETVPRPEQKLDLEQEIEWVDRIRLAVEADDGSQFRLARRYHQLYPNGQLKVEVERLCRTR